MRLPNGADCADAFAELAVINRSYVTLHHWGLQPYGEGGLSLLERRIMLNVPAILLLTLAVLVLSAPLIFALYRTNFAWVAVPLHGILWGWLLFHHLGFAVGSEWKVQASALTSQGQCEEMLRETEQAGLILERGNGGTVVVRRELWEGLPELAQDAVTRCLASTQRGGGTPSQIRIEQR